MMQLLDLHTTGPSQVICMQLIPNFSFCRILYRSLHIHPYKMMVIQKETIQSVKLCLWTTLSLYGMTLVNHHICWIWPHAMFFCRAILNQKCTNIDQQICKYSRQQLCKKSQWFCSTSSADQWKISNEKFQKETSNCIDNVYCYLTPVIFKT